MDMVTAKSGDLELVSDFSCTIFVCICVSVSIRMYDHDFPRGNPVQLFEQRASEFVSLSLSVFHILATL